MKTHKQKKIDAKSIFDRYLALKIIGKDSDETIAICCGLDYHYFYDVAITYKLRERHISSLVGFKDEFFVLTLIRQMIKELKLDEVFYTKKVTANRRRGLLARKVRHNDTDVLLTLGGDCVIFKKQDDKPVMIIRPA